MQTNTTNGTSHDNLAKPLKHAHHSSYPDEDKCDPKRIPPFRDVREYYREWFQYVKSLYIHQKNMCAEYPLDMIRDESGSNPRDDAEMDISNLRLDEMHDRLMQRTKSNTELYPLEILAQHYHLDDNERNMLVYVFMKELAHESCQLAEMKVLISSDEFDSIKKEDYFSPASTLRFHDLIVFEELRHGRIGRRSDVAINPILKERLLKGEGKFQQRLNAERSVPPYADNKEFLKDWITYIRKHTQFIRHSEMSFDDKNKFPESDDPDLISSSSPFTNPLLANLEEHIITRSQKSKFTFPLSEMIVKYKLSFAERNIILLLLDAYLQGKDCNVREIVENLCDDPFDQIELRRYFGNQSKLQLNKLISVSQQSFFPGEVELSPSFRDIVLGQSSQKFSLGAMIQGSNLLRMEAVNQTLNDLVLPDSITVILEESIKRFKSNADDLLRQWGILKTGQNGSMTSSLKMIFSGPSGCGKTYTAGALANSLGRQIVVTDISKMLSKYVGETQQNVSKLFNEYEMLVDKLESPPVLLMDECDQLFGMRSQAIDTSVDRMYNQILDLILDRLDCFHGILIATTNIIGNLDPALSRRFHHKVNFPLPNEDARKSLWHKHLKPPIPTSPDIDISHLAHDFTLTGGQIKIVVHNAAVRASVRGDVVTMNDLLTSCENERQGAFGTQICQKPSIGFIA